MTFYLSSHDGCPIKLVPAEPGIRMTLRRLIQSAMPDIEESVISSEARNLGQRCSTT